jgi:hypothetical protein
MIRIASCHRGNNHETKLVVIMVCGREPKTAPYVIEASSSAFALAWRNYLQGVLLLKGSMSVFACHYG